MSRPRLRPSLLLAFAGFGVAVAVAQRDPGEPVLTADFDYASRYVFRGIPHAGGSAQASVEFAANGLRAGVWTNQPFHRDDDGEVDVTAAYARQVSPELNLEFAIMSYNFTETQANLTRHSLEVGLTATLKPIAGFTPSLAVQHDFQLDSNSVQGALASSVALPRLGAYLEWSVFGGWVDTRNLRPDARGPRIGDGYGYFGGEAHVPYRIGAHSTLSVGLHGTATANQDRANAVSGRVSPRNLWVTFGLSVDF